jgi:hypothetical protein
MPRQRIQNVRHRKMVIMDIQEKYKRPHDEKLKASALVPKGKFYRLLSEQDAIQSRTILKSSF